MRPVNRAFTKLFGAAVFGLAAALAAPTASAAIVTGNWDPALPNNFGNYGWTATINVKVADGCGVGQQAVSMVNLFGLSFGCNGNVLPPVGAFRILTAEVGIYDLTTNVIKDVLRFDPSSFGAFWYAELDLGPEGEITYLRTLWDSNRQRSALTYADGCKYDFKLALPGADPAVRYRQVGKRGTGCTRGDGYTTATTPPDARQFFVSADSAQADVIAQTRLEIDDKVFSAVPEPGSLALALLALGVAGATAGRRSRRLVGSA